MTSRPLDLNHLRIANTSRQLEWPGGENVDTAFRGVELGGEVGELADAILALAPLTAASGRLQNLLKKITRHERSISGNEEAIGRLMADVQDEAGDVLICLDLVCMELGVDLTVATRAKFNKTSKKHGLKTML